jgi:hypothetical protein
MSENTYRVFIKFDASGFLDHEERHVRGGLTKEQAQERCDRFNSDRDNQMIAQGIEMELEQEDA